MAHLDERVILIEDTRELQCAASDVVALRTRPGIVGMADLVRSTLRLRPDRIIVGEVRGAEALDMLKAWNTGHPGGIATVHANSAASALYRLEQLVQETVATVPRRLIAEAIDMIVFIAGRGLARRIETIARVAGVDPDGGYVFIDLTPDQHPQPRSDEHTSALQSLMRLSYAVSCLKKQHEHYSQHSDNNTSKHHVTTQHH